jgi:hypothetical protein
MENAGIRGKLQNLGTKTLLFEQLRTILLEIIGLVKMI